MSEAEIEQLKSVKDFETLVEYLRDALEWQIDAEKTEDITFDYNPTELGIDKKHAAKIKTIKQIRPLTDNQPWGLFYVEFEPKKLPVVVLRRILKALIHSRRQIDDRRKTWDPHDLIFISALGEENERKITFAHFSEAEKGLPELRTFSWDASDTYLHYLQNTLDIEKLRWPANEADAAAWHDQWSSAFTLKHRYVPTTSEKLAKEMARHAAQIRDQVKSVYDYELASGPLHKLFESFKKVLIYDLEVDTFADMYAQTIAYGLFSAKATHEGEFAIDKVSAMIPTTNPFLRNLFEECTRIGETQRDCLDLEELGVTELVKMLKGVNIEAILQDFGRQKRGEDPVIHFYEDFLREYDPKKKVKRGVFYTPDPVVSFIVRSVDYLLRTEFGCPDGLADTSTIPVTYKNTKINGEVIEEVKQVPKVQILDPATGTGTFLKYVIEEIRKTFEENHKDLSAEELRKEWNEYVDKNLLSRVFGFELLMAPYAIAHLKLGLKLKETGYEFLSHQRLGVALTNALESGTASAETLKPHLGWLAQESRYADHIKTSENVSVVIGNPPYANYGMLNKNEWILKLLEDYKKDLNEKKINIDDDYIKFLRFAHWKIEKTGKGIVGVITNNSFLNGLIHRRMRGKLLEDFDVIYILNLHGNARIGETSPDGSVDQNVFDIKQGVSIIFFVKKDYQEEKCKVLYYDLYGRCDDKYEFLIANDIKSVEWENLEIEKFDKEFKSTRWGKNRFRVNLSFFVPRRNIKIIKEYGEFFGSGEIFKTFGSGVKTDRDELVIDFTKGNLAEKMKKAFNGNYDKNFKEKYKIKNSSSYNLVDRLKEKKFEEENIREVQYRPFDIRYVYYNVGFTSRPNYKVMKNFLENRNYGLVFPRICKNALFDYGLIVDGLIDVALGGKNTGSETYLAPLYLYQASTERKDDMPGSQELVKTVNFTRKFQDFIKANYLSHTPTSKDILSYIYALMYCPTYRKKYLELLKIDFPRIPFTSNEELFSKLSRLGEQLTSLHLMESPELDNLITEFKGEGDNVVAAIGKKSYKNGKLRINKTQYFEGIPEEVYNFHIGGYQVCEKWLKDRKGRELTEEEIEHYQKIVVAINETIRIMKEIDEVIEGHGGWPVR